MLLHLLYSLSLDDRDKKGFVHLLERRVYLHPAAEVTRGGHPRVPYVLCLQVIER